jgi:uncharacterized protein (TIGR02117 family)
MAWRDRPMAAFSVMGILTLWLLLFSTGSWADGFCEAATPSCKSIFIAHDSWHAAIVLSKNDIAPAELPESADFPGADFIEFSWGDQDYFPDPHSGFIAAIKAALWSSGSVIHLVGFSGALEQVYRGAEIIELRLSLGAFNRLLESLSKTFLRTQGSSRAPAASGLFPNSRFYPATPKFSLLRTCNTWVAEVLESAGVPVSPRMVFTAGNLASQLAPLALRSR